MKALALSLPIAVALAHIAVAPAQAEDQLHIWIKAFIPNSHPSRPTYVRKLPGDPPRWAIPGPTVPWTDVGIPILFDTCFETDNRGLTQTAPSPIDSARATSEIVLVYDDNAAKAVQAEARAYHRAGPSHEVDCASGKVLKEGLAETDKMHFGTPAAADHRVEVVVNAEVRNPLAPRFGTPTIDYGGSFDWDVKARRLRFKGYTGIFPAYEAYASLNGGPPVRIFGLMPEDGTSTWHLYDLGLHINTRSFIAEVELPEKEDGLTQTAQVQRTLTKENLEREVFVANGAFQQLTKAPEASFLTAIASSATQAGQPTDEVKAKLAQARETLNSEQKKLSEYGLDLGLSATKQAELFATALVESGVVRDLPLNERLQTLAESLGRGDLDYVRQNLSGVEGVQEPALTLAEFERSEFGRAFDLYKQDTQGRFSTVYDLEIAPILNTSPAGGLDAILSSNPKFSGQPIVKGMIDYLRSHSQADGSVVLDNAVLLGVKAYVPQAIKSLDPVINTSVNRLISGDFTKGDVADAALDAIRQKTGVDVLRAKGAVESLENGLTLGNAGAGLFLAETVVGVVNPKLGRDIGRVGAAALQFAQVVNSYGSVSKLGSLALSGGAATMTGGVLGATVLLSGIAGGADSQDTAVLTAVEQLRQQIETLRQEMHARFDRIDSELNSIYADMMQQFALVQKGITDLKVDVTAIRSDLARIERRLEGFDMRVSEAIDRLYNDLAALQMEPCVAWRDTTVIYDMPPDLFVECLSRFARLAVPKYPSAAPVATDAIDLGALSARLDPERPPTDRLPFVAALAAGAGSGFVPNSRLEEVMPPADWIAAASSYLRVAQNWPQHYRGTPLTQLRVIIDRGKFLSALLSNTSRPETSGNLIKSVMAKYTATLAALDAKVHDIDKWFASDQPRQDEKWDGSIVDCEFVYRVKEKNGFEHDEGEPPSPFDGFHYPAYDHVEVSLSNPLRTVPILARQAARLGLGSFRWCIRDSDMMRDYKPVHAPLELLSIGVFEVRVKDSKLIRLRITQRWLTTASSYDLPWANVVGGSVGVAQTGDPKALIKTAWKELEPQFVDNGSQSAVGTLYKEYQDAVTTGRYTAKKLFGGELSGDTQVLNDLLAPVLSAAVYERLHDDQGESLLRELEKDRILVREFTRLASTSSVIDSDLLSMLVEGNAPLVSSATLERAKNAGVDALKLGQVGEKRAEAVVAITDRSLTAAGSAASENAIDSLLRRLESFYSEQVRLCAAGVKPPGACQVPQ